MKNNKPDTTSDSTPRPAKRRLSTRRRLAMAGLVTATVATGLVVASADISSAGSTADSKNYTIETFRETIKPWDSIDIPTMQCQGGWLIDHDYSPGRIVPKGVEITGDSGSIGTTITNTQSRAWEQLDRSQWAANYGTNGIEGWSYATNWDPFSSHELVVNLHCSTDPSVASKPLNIPGFNNG